MSNPVDLTNLREITDGDRDLEKELFEDFITSCEEKMKEMEDNCVDGESQPWKNSAHAIKGISMNLGADNLAKLCKQAQDNFGDDMAAKKELLASIQAEYALVKKYLNEL